MVHFRSNTNFIQHDLKNLLVYVFFLIFFYIQEYHIWIKNSFEVIGLLMVFVQLNSIGKSLVKFQESSDFNIIQFTCTLKTLAFKEWSQIFRAQGCSEVSYFKKKWPWQLSFLSLIFPLTLGKVWKVVWGYVKIDLITYMRDK